MNKNNLTSLRLRPELRIVSHDFELQLDALRDEFIDELQDIDLVRPEIRERLMRVMLGKTRALLAALHNNLVQISGGHFEVPRVAPDLTPAASWLKAGALAAILGAGTSMAASTLIVSAATTGMLWWKASVPLSIAAVAGGAVGVGTVVATGGLGLLGGVGGALAGRQIHRHYQRRKLRAALLQDFDTHVFTRVREWAAESLAGASRVLTEPAVVG